MNPLPPFDEDAPVRRPAEEAISPAAAAVVGLLLVALYVLAVILLQPGR
jgi:hypothetical protein